MTTSTFTAVPQVTTDAEFRNWGGGFAAALAAVGMVKTADTGQINWATVLKPASGNTQQGYEIWRFNDTLQATAPIFLRVGYGAGATVAVPSLFLTVGKGSDGAGTITGQMQAGQQITPATTDAVARNWYLSSGDGSLLTFAISAVTANNWQFALERSRNPAGAATGTSMFLAWQAGAITGTRQVRTYNYAAASTVNPNCWPCQPPADTASTSSLAVGGAAPVFPATLWDGAGNFWQPRAVLTGLRNDVGAFAAVTVPGFGTYLPLGAQAQCWDGLSGAQSSAMLAYY
jgi:hypothetical protein